MRRNAPSFKRQPDEKVQSLVAEFMEEKRRANEAATLRAPRRINRNIVTAMLALLCLGAWLAPYPTSFSYAPADPNVERASARVRLYLVAQSVARFKVQHGRLPLRLSEAGVEGHDIVFVRANDRDFALHWRDRNDTPSYDSSQPTRSILGNAEQVIAQTGH